MILIEIRHENIDGTIASKAGYDRLFSTEVLTRNDSFYLWVLGLLKPAKESLLLDVSCGQGRLVDLANRRYCRSIGVDFSVVALQTAVAKSATVSVAAADGELLPIPTHYVDCLTHLGSLEHYDRPMDGVREIVRVLKPGGKACILLPNAYGLFGNIQHVWRHGDVFDDGQPIQRYGTRGAWQRLLESGGLQVESVVSYSEGEVPRSWGDVSRVLRHWRKTIRTMMAPIVPVNLANQLVFLCHA